MLNIKQDKLRDFLTAKADELSPMDDDCRAYYHDINPDAIDGDKWLENSTSYIWKVGVLAQWDSNKCDYARLFIGHEREIGNYEFIGALLYADGENDDIGRSLKRICEIAGNLHPAFDVD